MPSTHIPVPEKDYGGSPGSLNHSRRSSDDLRRQISRLKSDLEAEKAKVKQANRDKIVEVKRIQENSDKEKQKAVDSVARRLHGEHSVELKRQKESIVREKETELRQVLKFKDEEVKSLKHQVQEEKERTKRAEDELRRELIEKSREETADNERKLRNDISILKDEKHKLEEMYKLKAASDLEKAEIIRRLEAEHEVERHRLIRESKRASAKELQQIRSTARALEGKNQELAFKDQLTRRLEAEKDQLRRQSDEWDSTRRLSMRTGSFDEESFEGRDDSTYNKRDRERELIKRNADLQAMVHQLEKKCAMLEKHQNNRHESSTSKGHANTEEKIKKLKKRNAELVAIARQLEDKAKKLQDEKTTSQKSSNSTREVDHVKKMFVKQRAKDLAEHAKTLLVKDNELEQIRKQLGVSKTSDHSENGKVEELERLIRQSERERLLLEKQIQSPVQSRITSPLHSEELGDLQRRLGIVEDENEDLKTAVKKLEKVEEERIKLSWVLKEKSEECKRLLNDLEVKQTKCARMELEREKFVAKCTMLQKKNSEMNKKMKHLEGLEKEIEAMKEDLQSAEEMFKTSEAECNKLRLQLESLLEIEQDLRTSEDQRKLLEEEHVATVDILAERDQEIQQLYKIQEEANRAHEMTITSLDDEIRGLEQKCAESEDKYNKFHDKHETLKKQPANVATAHKQTQTASRPLSPGSNDTTDEEENVQVKDSRVNGVAELSNSGSPHLLSPGVAGLRSKDELQEEGSDVGKSDNSDILDQVSDRIRQLAASDSTSEEEPVSGIEKRADHSDAGPNMPDDGAEDDLTALSRRISMAAISDNSSSVSASEDNKYDSDTSQNFTGNLGDLEDNQRDSSAPEDEQLEATETKRKGKSKKLNHHTSERDRGDSTSGSEDGSIDEKYLSKEENQINPEEGGEEKLAVYIARYSYDPYQHSPNDNPEAELAFQAGEYLYVFGEMDEDGFFIAELMNGQRGMVPSNFVERVADENDMPWLANGVEDDEGLSDSDEEDGQVVSPLDLLGESDGEQRRQVRMLKFSGRQHMNLRMPLDHFPDANLGDIDEEEEECDMRSDNTAEAVSSQDGLTSDDTDLEPFRVPSPKRLSLDRQFTRSVLLSWKPPPDMSPDDVKGYGVYVNGELRMMIKGPNKTKALVEDIEPEETYRVSVRTITSRGEESGDREAMLTIGRDASLAPSSVNATHVSPTSAKIEWLPGNSSFSHDIFVNDTYQRTIRPGTYQHTLTNLEPDQDYRVTVRARNPKQLTDNEGGRGWEIGDPLASETEFRTDPGGSPEPPLNVQVLESSSAASQAIHNGLEVTWIPVTITEKGTSNGARVTGYKVYINSVPCAEVTSPLADNVAVVPWMVERAAKKSKGNSLQLTVKTQCVEGESVNSNTVEVSLDMLKFKVSKLLKVKDKAKKPEQPCELVSLKRRDSTEGSLVNGAVDEHDAPERTENKQNNNQKELESNERVRTDNNQNHVPSLESRTKGKAFVWRADVQEESDCSDSGCSTRVERAWSSDGEQEEREDEEEEVVEICSPLPAQQTHIDHPQIDEVEICSPLPAQQTHIDHRQIDEGQDVPYESLEQNGEELEERVFESDVQGIVPGDARDKLYPTEKTEKLSPSQNSDHSRTKRTDSVSSTGAESSASDFDMEEFDASLKDFQSQSRKKDPNKTEGGSDVVIQPLESDESEVEDDSSELPLSVIEEEDEENATGGESQHGTSNRSGSLSEGFRSDDDVMDLLDDEPDSGEFVPGLYKPSMITDFPKSDKDLTRIEPLSHSERTENNDFSLSKYLPVVENPEDSEPDASVDLSNKPVENLQSVELSQEDRDRSGSFSDTEADQGGLQNAQMTSTPLSGSPQHQCRSAYDAEFAEHDTEPVSDADQEVDDSFRVETEGSMDPRVEPNVTEADRTYTVEDHERTATADEEPVKIFIALYDYDPSTMSPNPDAEDEELAFREGDLMRIYGDKDDDGFFWGEAHGRQGFVPYNLVSEVQLEDGEELSLPTSPVISPPPGPTQPAEQGVVSSPQLNSEDGPEGDASTSVEESEFEDPRNSANFILVPKRMVALFDYDPQQLSPNPDNEVELTFKVGDVVYVYGEMDPDGFYTGELRGIRGLVPSNFLEDLTEADEALDVPDTSRTSQDSSQEKIVTQNGTLHMTDETPKKKKGIFAKGKNLFKKITKEKKSKR